MKHLKTKVFTNQLYLFVAVVIGLMLINANVLEPILTLNLRDFTRSPLPPYRDSIARSIGGAAIYFSIIEGTTPYNATIDSTEDFVKLSKEWYAEYFLLGRELIYKCIDCDYSIIKSPSLKEATNSSKLYEFVIIQK